jgi:hypothetical protein
VEKLEKTSTSEKGVNYDTVIIYETIQIHQITSRNFNYFIKKSIYWQILVTNSNLPISACKLRILIYKIPFSLFICILLFIRVKLGLSTLLYYFHIYFFTRITFNVDYTHILQFILFIPLFQRPNISIDICILI